MARYRTIVGDRLWKHDVMRKAPLHVGRLYVYLITEGADCEGRFVADAFTLHAEAFSSRHGVTEADVETTLELLSQEYEVVLFYSEPDDPRQRRCGFLAGWYEHQRIPIEYRDGSSLPNPPVLCNSWATVERVYASYCDFQEQKRSTYKAALAWFAELDPERQQAYIAEWRKDAGERADLASYTTVAQNTDNSSATLNKGKEGEGEVEEEKDKEESTEAVHSAPPSPSESEANDNGLSALLMPSASNGNDDDSCKEGDGLCP